MTTPMLDYFQARYYSAEQGRFVSPDPAHAGANLYNPQSWNGYAYVLNNPLSNVDPFGLWNWSVGNCYYNTVGAYVNGEFQGYDTQFLGCFDLGGMDRLSLQNDGQQTSPQPPPQRQQPQPAQPHTIDCSHAPSMPPTPAGANVAANQQATRHHDPFWWLKQVLPGGAWDYKNHVGQQYDSFGNFNYGATCNTLGLSLEACQRGAGLAAIATGLKNAADPSYPTNTFGTGDPFGSLATPNGRPANDNGIPNFGDQPGGRENQSVVAGYGYAQWRKACGS